jgi:nitrogenase-associated protein
LAEAAPRHSFSSAFSSKVQYLATVIFYQKPGCGTNARQKRALELAGHTVIAKDLLAERWTAESLLSFFGSTPVCSWFNAAAPRVKSGEVDPANIDAATALTLMVVDPLLIRRPLVESGEQKCAGFDREPVTSMLSSRDAIAAIQGCIRQDHSTSCPASGQSPNA